VGGTTAERISKCGGPGYFWLPTEDFSGLPLANFALQVGQVKDGHKPSLAAHAAEAGTLVPASAMSRRVPASAAICRRAADNS
jgi:hypothetical protein